MRRYNDHYAGYGRLDPSWDSSEPLADYYDEPEAILTAAMDYMAERGCDAEEAIELAREFVAQEADE